MIEILHDLKGPELWEILGGNRLAKSPGPPSMVYSLLWVMKDLYHQPYHTDLQVGIFVWAAYFMKPHMWPSMQP